MGFPEISRIIWHRWINKVYLILSYLIFGVGRWGVGCCGSNISDLPFYSRSWLYYPLWTREPCRIYKSYQPRAGDGTRQSRYPRNLPAVSELLWWPTWMLACRGHQDSETCSSSNPVKKNYSDVTWALWRLKSPIVEGGGHKEPRHR